MQPDHVFCQFAPIGQTSAIERLEARQLLAAATSDASFGGGGLVQTEFPLPTASQVVDMARQSDGKLLVVASSMSQGLVRYHADGAIDTAFGNQGEISQRVLGAVVGVAMQPDGKIVTAAFDNDSDAIVVTRLLDDGTLDPGYGTGGQSRITGPAPGFNAAADVAVDSLGRAVIVGTSDTNESDVVALRLTVDGELDASFASGGIHTAAMPGFQYGGSVLVQPDDRIILASRPFGSALVQRLTAEGQPDASFGTGGQVTPPTGMSGVQAMTLQPDGKLVIAGRNTTSTHVVNFVRYLTTGQPDGTYGSGGNASVVFAGNFVPTDVFSIAAQADNKIVAAGTLGASAPSFGVVRLTTGGNLDTRFDGDGRSLVTTGAAFRVLVQPDGKIVAGGRDGANKIALARLGGTNGAVDSTFGTAGVARTDGTYTTDEVGVAVGRQSTGKVLALARITPNSGLSAGLIRFDANGTIDPTFGNAGRVRIDGLTNVYDMIVLEDDRILVLTYNNLYQFTPDGAPDTTFGGGDGIQPNPNRGSSFARDALGRIYLNAHSKVVRHLADGAIDTSFDTDGVMDLPPGTAAIGEGIAVQPDQKVVVFHGLLTRITPEAAVDMTFGTNGQVSSGNVFDMVIQPDGKIVTAGHGDHYTIKRFDPDGSPDETFDADGIATMDLGWQRQRALALAVYPDGTILAAGYLDTDGGRYGNSGLIQLKPDGSPDPALDGTGFLRFIDDADGCFDAGILIEPDGKTLLVGFGGYLLDANVVSRRTDLAVARLWGRANLPPSVAEVFVNGTAWAQPFRDFLGASGAGDATYGYRINVADPTNELPWTNLNQVSIRFSEDVPMTPAAFAIYGVNVAAYGGLAFNYDAATFTATWTLPAGTAFDRDKLLLHVEAGGASDVNDAALADDYQLRLNVLPGDVNGSGTILGTDVTLVRNAQGSAPGTGLYTIFKDVNGSASILGTDVTLVRNRQGLTLPTGEPTAAAETTSTAMAGTFSSGGGSSLFATGSSSRSAMRLLAQQFDLLGDALETPLVA